MGNANETRKGYLPRNCVFMLPFEEWSGQYQSIGFSIGRDYPTQRMNESTLVEEPFFYLPMGMHPMENAIKGEGKRTLNQGIIPNANI